MGIPTAIPFATTERARDARHPAPTHRLSMRGREVAFPFHQFDVTFASAGFAVPDAVALFGSFLCWIA
jgi:hypothetical protein